MVVLVRVRGDARGDRQAADHHPLAVHHLPHDAIADPPGRDGAPIPTARYRTHDATPSPANDGAATSAAAPRSLGYCSGGTATPARTVSSIRSHAAVISPPR